MSIMETMIGWIAPPVCVICGTEGYALCDFCRASQIMPYGERCFDCGAISPLGRTCERCAPGAPRHVWVSTNYDDAARELIKKYKFDHQRVAAETLASMMSQTLLGFNDLQALRELDYLIVPVPTAASRVRQRSFDHSAHLARQIGQDLNIWYSNALIRLGHSRQVGADRSVRLSQLAGSFIVRNPLNIRDQNILLVDDVVTTGATLRAATRALRAAGAARIDALVFAKKL